MLGSTDNLLHVQHSTWLLIAVVLVVFFALYVFVKIEHFLIRLFTGVVGLAVIAGALWWWFARS